MVMVAQTGHCPKPQTSESVSVGLHNLLTLGVSLLCMWVGEYSGRSLSRMWPADLGFVRYQISAAVPGGNLRYLARGAALVVM